MTPEQERRQINDNISMAFVNGHITAQEAAEAHDALAEHAAEIAAQTEKETT